MLATPIPKPGPIVSSFLLRGHTLKDPGPAFTSSPDTHQQERQERQEQVEHQEHQEVWVILLAFQRSGTHWLSQELKRHPCVHMAPEILFAPGLKEFGWNPLMRRAVIKKFFGLPLSQDERQQKLPSTAQEFAKESDAALQRGCAVRGFNWKVSQGFLQDLLWIKSFIAQHLGQRLVTCFMLPKTKTTVRFCLVEQLNQALCLARLFWLNSLAISRGTTCGSSGCSGKTCCGGSSPWSPIAEPPWQEQPMPRKRIECETRGSRSASSSF